jgi:geranylgeranyl pyrophosphate synthase
VRLLPSAELRRLVADVRRGLSPTPAIEPHLAGAVRDILGAPGSLIRAQLAYGCARALGAAAARARAAAVAVEYLHTASLVFDDLPAMDDAGERRGRPCPHRTHGEGAAILAGLALVHRAHALVAQAVAGLPAARDRRAWSRLEECIGLGGILDGQARDLHFVPGTDPSEVAAGKTTPLLRLALLLPAALAGAAPELEERLDRVAAGWGVAYQALDDFRDLRASWIPGGKTARRDAVRGRPNLVLAIGRDAALARVELELETAHARIAEIAATPAAAAELATVLGRLNRILESEADRLTGRRAAGG